MSASPEILSLIPHRPPFLFVDEIVQATPKGLVTRRTFRAEEEFYKGHYPGAPITPGVLLCEAVFQSAGIYMARKALAAGLKPGEGVPLIAKISDVRFRSPVYPGDTILIEVTEKEAMGGFTMLSGSMTNQGKRVMTLDFSVAWKVPENMKLTGESAAPAAHV
jgi:3-hydroxyacyl-[acyl-carrier-protein] dehydratase